MPCDTVPFTRGQTLTERKDQVKKKMEEIDRMLVRKKVVPKVDKTTGAIAFTGLSEENRGGIRDGCVYRRIMTNGSALAKAEIARAEALAGRAVDKKIVGQGTHSHDGGETFHPKD